MGSAIILDVGERMRMTVGIYLLLSVGIADNVSFKSNYFQQVKLTAVEVEDVAGTI